MTNDIAQILNKYDGQDAGIILASPSIERDIALIGKFIKDNDNADTKDAQSFLLQLLGEIDVKMDELRMDQASEKTNFDHIQKMSDACIAYMTPNGRKDRK